MPWLPVGCSWCVGMPACRPHHSWGQPGQHEGGALHAQEHACQMCTRCMCMQAGWQLHVHASWLAAACSAADWRGRHTSWQMLLLRPPLSSRTLVRFRQLSCSVPPMTPHSCCPDCAAGLRNGAGRLGRPPALQPCLASMRGCPHCRPACAAGWDF